MVHIRMRLHTIAASALVSSMLAATACPAQTDSATTSAWRDGQFHVDAAGVIGRSDIVLGRANIDAKEAMPLGNGSLGVAVCADWNFPSRFEPVK